MKKASKENLIDDEMLVRFFDAKEAGKSFPDALHTIGETPISDADLVELHALWDLHGSLVRTAHNASPDRALLQRTLVELSAVSSTSVTQPSAKGYAGETDPGAVSYFNNKFNLFMNINWKIVAPVAVVLIFVVVSSQVEKPVSTELAVNVTPEIALMSATGPADDPSGAMAMKSMSRVEAPPVSGNVDDLIASLTLEADTDASAFADADADIALVTADSQAITDLNTAYDETTF